MDHIIPRVVQVDTGDWVVFQNKALTLAGTTDQTLGIDYAGGIRMYGYANGAFSGATIWKIMSEDTGGEYSLHSYDYPDDVLAVAGNTSSDYVPHLYPSDKVSPFIGDPIGSWEIVTYDDGGYAFFIPGTNYNLSLAINSDNIAEISSEWDNGTYVSHIWYPQIAVVTVSVDFTLTVTATSFNSDATALGQTVTVDGPTVTVYSVQARTMTETVTATAAAQHKLRKRSDPTLTSSSTNTVFETITTVIGDGILTVTRDPVTDIALKQTVVTETITQTIYATPTSSSSLASSASSTPAKSSTSAASPKSFGGPGVLFGSFASLLSVFLVPW